MPLPFPKLHEKCGTHVCLIDNERGDERWEDMLGMSREGKDRACREDFEELKQRYYAESDPARLNTLGGYVGTLKIRTARFGIERRRCAIDSRGILVSMNSAMNRIITSFRPIIRMALPPRNHEQFKRDALLYYRRFGEKPWGQ